MAQNCDVPGNGSEEVVKLTVDNGADPRVGEKLDFGESKDLWVMFVNYWAQKRKVSIKNRGV